MVARRLIPLVVAFAVAFAPVALEACQVSCLEHSLEIAAVGSAHHHHADTSATSATPAGHVHHHVAEAQTSETSVGVGPSHVCRHGDDLPAFSAAVNTIVVGPAVVVSTFELPKIAADPLAGLDSSARRSSERIVLTTQLRV